MTKPSSWNQAHRLTLKQVLSDFDAKTITALIGGQHFLLVTQNADKTLCYHPTDSEFVATPRYWSHDARHKTWHVLNALTERCKPLYLQFSLKDLHTIQQEARSGNETALGLIHQLSRGITFACDAQARRHRPIVDEFLRQLQSGPDREQLQTLAKDKLNISLFTDKPTPAKASCSLGGYLRQLLWHSPTKQPKAAPVSKTAISKTTALSATA